MPLGKWVLIQSTFSTTHTHPCCINEVTTTKMMKRSLRIRESATKMKRIAFLIAKRSTGMAWASSQSSTTQTTMS